MPKTDKPDLRLTVRVDESPYAGPNRILHATATVAIIRPGGEVDWPNYDDGDFYALGQLKVSAQIDSDGRSADFYGHKVQMLPRHSDGLDLRDAEAAVKWLRLIERKTTALNSQFGYAGSFAHYIGRVGTALGIGAKTIGTRSNITGTGYSFSDVNMLSYHLAEQVRTWRTRYGHVEAA